MSDQAWALLAGAVTVLGLRVLDFILPKGWMLRWIHDHAVRVEDDSDDQDQDGDG